MRRSTVALAAFAPCFLLALAGCALSDAGGDDDGDDCGALITVTPAGAVAPITLVAEAEVSRGGFNGTVGLAWSVTGPGDTSVPVTLRNPEGTAIELFAGQPGSYEIEVSVSIGGNLCGSDSVTVAVAPSGVATLDVRLRYSPRPDQPAPPQDDSILVVVAAGTSELPVGQRLLDPGSTIASAVMMGGTGGVGAQLVFTPLAGRAVELFTDASGGFGGRLVNRPHDVVIVPYDHEIAPDRVELASPSLLGAMLPYEQGEPVSGTVTDAGGAALGNAWVAIAAGDLPPTLTQTAADGSFVTYARAGVGPLRVQVSPPPGGGHAHFVAPASLGLTATGGALTITLADAPVIAVSGLVERSTGEVLPGARVTFVASAVGPAGQVTQGGVLLDAPASETRVTVSAGAGGALPALLLPRAVYQVIVEPPAGTGGQVLAVREVDLSGPGAPPPLALATDAATPLALRVVDQDGEVVGSARVTVIARGVLGVGKGATFSDVADDATGVLPLSVPVGMLHDVVIDAPRGTRLARRRVTISAAAAAGGTLDIVLPPAIVVTGSLIFQGSTGQPGVRVAAHCEGVGCADPSVPLAETVTGAGGAFELLLPDPGVSP